MTAHDSAFLWTLSMCSVRRACMEMDIHEACMEMDIRDALDTDHHSMPHLVVRVLLESSLQGATISRSMYD